MPKSKALTIPANSIKPGRMIHLRAAKKTAVAKRKGAKLAARTRRVRLYAPVSVPQITRGEKHEEQHYVADADGAIMVPSTEVQDFLAMGCSREPQEAPKVVNHVEPETA